VSLILVSKQIRALAEDSRSGFVSSDEQHRRIMEITAALGSVASEHMALHLEFVRGAGLAMVPFLHVLAANFMFAWGLQRAVEKGRTAAQMTGYLLRWLPWLALLIAQFAGLGPLAFLLGHWVGWLILGLSVAMSFAAGRISRRMVARVTAQPIDPGLWLTLVATALRQGVGVNRCVAELRRVTGVRNHPAEQEIVAALETRGSMALRLETGLT